ncbi:hypothetical protein [Hasllibacter sp. MH4015]|uniref:hypothetical protein n=1 Tax=Hasllibacter sp. MH4015 TaxID=2854029 RepID=UPI001CD343FD|nr:hypothetical protein [Hasllibacter sp. MH4015]
MSDYTRRDLPADITVLAGEFASQPLVFAHLLDEAPNLDLTHVEVIQANHAARLAARFDAAQVAGLPSDGTVVLILPAAHPGAECPIGDTAHLRRLGTFRGTIPHLSAAP